MYKEIEQIKDSCLLRSRFACFIHGVHMIQARRHRCREPSRVPVKRIKRMLRKRKYRKMVIRVLSGNLPKTSFLYQIMKLSWLWKAVLCDSKKVSTEELENLKGNKNDSFNWCVRINLLNREVTYRDGNHRMMHVSVMLRNDIETNPAPGVVDPSKNICPPYSQDEISVFGHNAGKQCAAMSLSAIVYNYNYGIRCMSDLIEIMNLGNELYSYLSHSAQQEYLMFSEMPEVVCVRDVLYNLEYSESWHGNTFLTEIYLKVLLCLCK